MTATAAAIGALTMSAAANASSFLDLSGGLTGWTTRGTVNVLNTTDAFTIGGNPFSLTPAAGHSMAKITASGGTGEANTMLGLGASTIENLLNINGGQVSNFGLMTNSFSLNAGTYSFAWAYAAEDYVPYNDGVFFSLVGGGTESLISLARNGSGGSDTSGPSPGTLILGSYGSTSWQTTSFTITTSGTYQLGWGAYNWNDTSLNPNLFISGIAGTFTGNAPPTTGGGGGPIVIGSGGGNVSPGVFDTNDPAYAQAELEFDGGTLQYTGDTTTNKDATLSAGGGGLDTNGFDVDYTGTIFGGGDLWKVGTGTLTLTETNAYTGLTTISTGVLALSGSGSIATSSGVVSNGTFDISATDTGATVQTLSGSGAVELGDKTLTLANATGTFGGVIDGTGGLTVASGTETLTGANTFSGATTVANGASLALSGAGSVAMSVGITNNGTFDISGTTGGASITSMSGTGAVALGNKTLTMTSASGGFDGTISGAGGVTISGGSKTLTGSQAFTGATTVASGATLALSGAGSVASSSGLINQGTFDISGTTSGASLASLTGAGTVALGGKTLTIANASGEFGGALSGTGSLHIAGGTQKLSGASLHSGGTAVTNGAAIEISNDSALGDVTGALTLDTGTLKALASLEIVRSVNLTGTAAFDVDGGNSLVSSGSLAGNGRLTKTGDGTLVLSGDNSSWGQAGDDTVGGLTIEAGTVEVASSAALGNGALAVNSGTLAASSDVVIGNTIALGEGAVVRTDGDATMTLGGTVQSASGDACFEKQGTGRLVMTGSATMTIGTCVMQGGLYANGTLNSIVTVQSDGTLRGAGLITGPVTVHGTLAPGNSPGTLTIANSVTMADGSTYSQDINGTGTSAGPGNYSRLILTGVGSQFTASGATLVPNLVNITGSDTYTPYVPALGDTFRIVTADGGIVGEFADVVQPDGLDSDTRIAAFYGVGDSNSIDLRVLPTSYAGYLGSHGGNQNARSAGVALDAIVAGGAERSSELRYAVAGLNGAQLESVATALAGEVHGALAASVPGVDQWLQSSVMRQMGTAADAGSALWVDVSRGSGDWDSDSFASAFDIDRTQLALGFDLLRIERARIGVGFSHADLDASAFSASGSMQENLGFLYGRYHFDRFVVDALAGAGSSSWEADRIDPIGLVAALESAADGRNALFGAGLRWQWNATRLNLQPYARLTWQEARRDGFVEQGTSPSALTIDRHTVSGTRLTAGLSGGTADRNPLAAPFTLQFDLGAALDDADLVRPTLGASLMGEPLTIAAPQVGRGAILGNVTVTGRLMSRGFVFFGVSGEARSGRSDDVAANVGVRIAL